MGTGKREKVRREAEKMDSCASRAHTSNFHFARGSDEQRQPANPLRRRRVVARFREIRPSGGGGGGERTRSERARDRGRNCNRHGRRGEGERGEQSASALFA